MHWQPPIRAIGLAATLGLASAVALAGGRFEPVPLHDDEQHLIDSSDDLAAYFSTHALLYTEPNVLSLVRRVGHDIRPASDRRLHRVRVLRAA